MVPGRGAPVDYRALWVPKSDTPEYRTVVTPVATHTRMAEWVSEMVQMILGKCGRVASANATPMAVSRQRAHEVVRSAYIEP